MAKLLIKNTSQQAHEVGYRDARGDLVFVRVDPGATEQIGAGLDLPALERIAELLSERYGAARIAALPLLPDHKGLALDLDDESEAISLASVVLEKEI